jgi:hypothetical protein
MGFLDFLFKKKDKVEVKEEEEEVVEAETKVEEAPTPSSRPEPNAICGHCGMGIYAEQRSIKCDGVRYHNKPCFRQLKRQARKALLG